MKSGREEVTTEKNNVTSSSRCDMYMFHSMKRQKVRDKAAGRVAAPPLNARTTLLQFHSATDWSKCTELAMTMPD